jgi:predicted regulator of Ras-like GTPase activity (Roadblock/LC7/MglB family)
MKNRYHPAELISPSLNRLSHHQTDQIERLIDDVFKSTAPHMILLAAHSGTLLSSRTGSLEVDASIIASLAAGQLQANNQLMSILDGERDSYVFIREGLHSNLFLAEAGPHLFILVVTTNQQPIGWVRIQIQKAATQLCQILEMPDESSDSNPLSHNPVFAESLDNALKDIWSE